MWEVPRGCQGFDEKPKGQYQGDIEDQDKENGDILQAGEDGIGTSGGEIKSG